MTRQGQAGISMAGAVGLLILTGGLLSISIALSRVGMDGGIPPLAYAFWFQTMAAAGLVLTVLLRGEGRVPRRGEIVYMMIGAVISFTAPNALLVYVVQAMGAGFGSFAFAFSPIFTYVIAVMVGLDRLSGPAIGGLGFGFVGAAAILGSTLGAAELDITWAALGLLIPLSLAFGNVFRSWFWPKGASPLFLAAGMMVFSALGSGGLHLVLGAAYLPFAGDTGMEWTFAVHGVLIALQYVLFFALQLAAGPFFISQISYVILVIGMAIGVLVLGERYPLLL
ncbi:MAG: DMT family transporter [Azospirillaceae bacterium]